MSSVDRAFIRAYGPESPELDDPAAEYTRGVPVFPGGPTIEQLYDWKKKGLRIDLPGSPINESDLDDAEQYYEPANPPAEVTDTSAFAASAQNTAAVAAAVDRILQRVRSERQTAQPAPLDEIEKPAAPSQARRTPPAESPKTEKPPAKTIAPPSGKTNDRLEWESMLAKSSTAPALFRPQWEAPRFAWPATIEMLLERGVEGFVEVRDRLTEVGAKGKKVIAVYSFASGEGCTTLTLCLAKLLSDSGVKTAIVDASDNNPELATRLGVRVEHGWEAIAAGGPTVEDAAIHSVADDLTLAPSKAKGSPEKLDQMLHSMKGSYDMILVDIGQIHEVPTKLNQVDAAMIVRDLRISDDSQVAEVVRRLGSAGVSILGVTENFVS
ncbi:tyrosine-protein kinase family protein [Blastopirellula marina]|uniref:Probable exopolysaccharide polymerization protein n=1 Tax=Blastopirellula marina DSM 3645 TaxID=314230 RepID=A3ZUJ1_9BACT|nr:exopolysaccharide polymerization protein [Blastopirellula marina]EAQ79901.1 probable exopolysaccharide polymerization protein [Blastopirellula marina DSM 3645]